MGHDHGHSHQTPARSLTIALALTVSYMVIEAIGGVLTGSLALLADAGHMLSDAGALAVALVAARLAERPPDTRQTMGYQRAEVLGAAVNAAALVVLALWIAVEALERVAAPSEVLAGPMMIVASIGLAVNLVVAWMLHRGAHSLNTRAALLHVLGDALGSVGALLAGALIHFGGYLWADPLVSILIAAILIAGSVRVLREVAAVLMHATPVGVDAEAVATQIRSMDGVRSLHDLHIWTLRPGQDVVTVHVVVQPGADPTEICAEVRQRLHGLIPTAHITVQPEPDDAPCVPPFCAPEGPHAHPH